MPATTSADQRVFNLQGLRILAAGCVMYLHFCLSSRIQITPAFGSFGVDIFFVISGFIISLIGANGANQFFLRRVIRIAPSYWIITLLWTGFLLVFPKHAGDAHVSLGRLLQSLMFLGSDPIVTRGWTLNYEMYFYVVFALCLLQRKIPVQVLCALVVVCMTIIIGISSDGTSAWAFYGDAMIIEFVFGIVVYYVWLQIPGSNNNSFQRALLVKQVLGLLVFILSLVAMAVSEVQDWQPRIICIGVPAFFCVASVLWCEKSTGMRLKWRPLQLMGDSAYIVYLIHPFLFAPLNRLVWPEAYLYPEWARVLLFFIAAGVAILISMAIHLFVEIPAIEFLKRLLARADGRKALKAAV